MKVIKEVSSGLLILNKCILQLPGRERKKKGGGQMKPEQFCDMQSIAEARLNMKFSTQGTLCPVHDDYRQVTLFSFSMLHYTHAAWRRKTSHASRRTKLTVLKLSKEGFPQEGQSNIAEEVPNSSFQLDKARERQEMLNLHLLL